MKEFSETLELMDSVDLPEASDPLDLVETMEFLVVLDPRGPTDSSSTFSCLPVPLDPLDPSVLLVVSDLLACLATVERTDSMERPEMPDATDSPVFPESTDLRVPSETMDPRETALTVLLPELHLATKPRTLFLAQLAMIAILNYFHRTSCSASEC